MHVCHSVQAVQSYLTKLFGRRTLQLCSASIVGPSQRKIVHVPGYRLVSNGCDDLEARQSAEATTELYQSQRAVLETRTRWLAEGLGDDALIASISMASSFNMTIIGSAIRTAQPR